MTSRYGLDEIKKHNSSESLWMIVDNIVYDLTAFADEHPGGKKIMVNAAGTDASELFWKFHNKKVLSKIAAKFKIGELQGATQVEVVEKVAEVVDDEYYGDMVPFGDPFYYQGFASPYYNETHYALRHAVRQFTDTYLTPNAGQWDEEGEIPAAEYKRVASAGILAAIVAGTDGLDNYLDDIKLPGDVPADKFDGFHNFIVIDELSRCASGGVLYGIAGGYGIGLPPIIHFGSDYLKKMILPGCLRGDDRICLAITEPSGGSDVANIITSADLTPDGKHYIVNGEKKWITGGVNSKFFVTAVRTGGKGFGGISLLVVERGEGVTTRKMKCTGVWASGTSYVIFENVKVPVENIVGEANKGFQLIMANFNPERIGIAIQANRFARVCLEECITYGSQRKTFGILLRDHPVIRNKLAHMARKVESTHAWIESVIFQSTQFSPEEMTSRAGGAIALLKAHATDTFEFCASEAAQIFGGNSYTRSGQGEKIERLNRDVKAYSIPGGSTELMLDLGIRQSIKIAEIMGAKL